MRLWAWCVVPGAVAVCAPTPQPRLYYVLLKPNYTLTVCPYPPSNPQSSRPKMEGMGTDLTPSHLLLLLFVCFANSNSPSNCVLPKSLPPKPSQFTSKMEGMVTDLTPSRMLLFMFFQTRTLPPLCFLNPCLTVHVQDGGHGHRPGARA